jgi:hypothetical protein
MKMNQNLRSMGIACVAGLAVVGATAQGQTNALINPSFEDRCSVASNWTAFGNVQGGNFFTTSGVRNLKMFGPFNGGLGYSGAFQDQPASPGQTFVGRMFITNPPWDAFSETGTRGFISVDFLDASGAFLNPFTQISPKITAPTDSLPVLVETPAFTAPAGTVTVRFTAYAEQENQIGGAGWYDDAVLENTANPGVNILANPSFELAPPNCGGSDAQGWTNFGNGQLQAFLPRTGDNAAKLFGGFSGPFAVSGWFQNVAATPGTKWKAAGWGRSFNGDILQPVNDVFVGIEFFDNANNNLVGTATRSSGVPTPGDDTYRFYETGIATAPENTAFARLVILQLQFDFAGGATWWDDMSLVSLCPADFNADGTVDFFDYLDFVAAFDVESPSADFNGDQTVDFFDYLDFVAAFDTECL